jgi:hypothetical protein
MPPSLQPEKKEGGKGRRSEKTKQNKTKQNKTKQNKTKQKQTNKKQNKQKTKNREDCSNLFLFNQPNFLGPFSF